MMVSSAVALRKPRSRLIDRFCGYCMGLPFFAELSASGLSLPQNHFEMIGVPLHSSLIALLLLLPQFKFRKSTLFYAVFFCNLFDLLSDAGFFQGLVGCPEHIFSYVLFRTGVTGSY